MKLEKFEDKKYLLNGNKQEIQASNEEKIEEIIETTL
jgi:hypothetical protein